MSITIIVSTPVLVAVIASDSKPFRVLRSIYEILTGSGAKNPNIKAKF